MPLPTRDEVVGALRAGHGLPPALYVEPDAFETERDALWSRSWVAVARWDEVAHPGDFVTFDLAGDPVVVVRDNEYALHAFPNVCRHRSATIMTGCGSARALQCPYHLWTWSLAGELRGAPEMPASFDKDAFGLERLAVEEWNGWVLVNLHPDAPSFASTVPSLTARCAEFDLASLERGPVATYVSNFNWKLQVENFGESYHHPGVHPLTLQLTYPGQQSWLEPNDGEPWLWLDHVATPPETPTFTANVVFPSLMFSILRGAGAIWFKLQPHGVASNTLEIVVLTPPGASESTKRSLLDGVREINDEDAVVNSRTHTGMRSRFAATAPVSHLESGVQDFRRWVAVHLLASLPPAG